MTEIWPFLITALFGAIGWQWKESHALKTKVAVLEKTTEDILKDIESMKRRQDSHSKKQDEILQLIQDFKLEVVKQIAEMASDLKTLNNTLEAYDDGVRFVKKSRKEK